MRAGPLKCRLVGREFAFLEDRDDLFAPGATATTSRIADSNAVKDSDENDPTASFDGDAISAYYQAPEEEDFFCLPPPEWLEARRQNGLSTEGLVWKLAKQLPGRRRAGQKWIGYCAKLVWRM